MKKIIISTLISCLLVFLFSIFFKELPENLSVFKGSEKTYLNENDLNVLKKEADLGNPISASKLVDFYLDHTTNYDQAKKYMEIAIRNGATWFSKKDVIELENAIKNNH